MKHKLKLLGFALLVILFRANLCLAIPQPTKANLLSDSDAIVSGNKVKVAVVFEIDPGWHIYGEKSGETGMPTRIRLSAPPDFVIGELQWPKAEEFKLPGDITGLGYSGKVTILAEISAPASVSLAETAIEANLSWLSCSPTLCIPTKKALKLVLPLKDKANSINPDVFNK